MNESCHTHEWVMSHTRMSHVTHMSSYHVMTPLKKSVTSHVWMCDVMSPIWIALIQIRRTDKWESFTSRHDIWREISSACLSIPVTCIFFFLDHVHLSLSQCVCLCLSQCVYLSLCHSVSLSVIVCLSVSLSQWVCLSLSKCWTRVWITDTSGLWRSDITPAYRIWVPWLIDVRVTSLLHIGYGYHDSLMYEWHHSCI